MVKAMRSREDSCDIFQGLVYLVVITVDIDLEYLLLGSVTSVFISHTHPQYVLLQQPNKTGKYYDPEPFPLIPFYCM